MMRTGRIWLSVPYDENEDAKKIGARWDAKAKKWWISCANLSKIKGGKRKWLNRGNYTILVKGKMHLLIADHICSECEKPTHVAGLLVDRVYELSPEWWQRKQNLKSQDPPYLSGIRSISDNKLQAEIDSLCPYFRPDRYNYYRNHCENCGKVFHDFNELYTTGGPLSPNGDLSDADRIRAITLKLKSPVKFNAGLEWLWNERHDLFDNIIKPRYRCKKEIEADGPLEEIKPIERSQIELSNNFQSNQVTKSNTTNFLAKPFVLIWRAFRGLFRIIFWLPVTIFRIRRISAWRHWNEARTIQQSQGAHLIKVLSIRQHAKTGTKADAEWIDSDNKTAIWVPNRQVYAGQYLVATGGMGRGPHHTEMVFYVNKLFAVLAPGTYSKWRREEARISKTGGNRSTR